jgi:hypothetical protein
VPGTCPLNSIVWLTPGCPAEIGLRSGTPHNIIARSIEKRRTRRVELFIGTSQKQKRQADRLTGD